VRSRGEVGLSALTEELLGKPLDKSSQVSDWARRPLTEAQLRWERCRCHTLRAYPCMTTSLWSSDAKTCMLCKGVVEVCAVCAQLLPYTHVS